MNMPTNKNESLAERFRRAEVVWAEDECARDAEGMEAAWKRLFGTERPEAAIIVGDYGDHMIFEYDHGRFCQVGPPRSGMTKIRVLRDPKPSTIDTVTMPADEARALRALAAAAIYFDANAAGNSIRYAAARANLRAAVGDYESIMQRKEQP